MHLHEAMNLNILLCLLFALAAGGSGFAMAYKFHRRKIEVGTSTVAWVFGYFATWAGGAVIIGLLFLVVKPFLPFQTVLNAPFAILIFGPLSSSAGALAALFVNRREFFRDLERKSWVNQ